MLGYFWIGLGGALGSMARFGVADWIGRRWGEAFPWGTLCVNFSGCFLIGLFAGAIAQGNSSLNSPEMRNFLLVGFLGGYTTFSSFSLQTLNLIQEGAWWFAGANVFLSVAISIAAAWAGHVLGDVVFR